jgi:hypothetical protein
VFEVLFSEEGGNDSDHEGVDEVQNSDGFGGLVFFHLLFEDIAGVFRGLGFEQTRGFLSFLHWASNFEYCF